MVGSRLDTIVRYVRQLRGGEEGTEPLAVSPSLPDSDLRKLRRLIDETVDRRGGEVAARRRARTIGATFSTLDHRGRRRFFELLTRHYDHDDEAVDRAMEAVYRAGDTDRRREAEMALREALEPRRERLLRRFAGLDGGLPFLIALREDLLDHVEADPDLVAVEQDLHLILEAWFDVALLRLEHLTWHSPAALLERLIEYEAVHAIESWDDLKGRLGPGRRCYAFIHPAMPDDPVVFVEVALTRGVATDLTALLDHSAERPDPSEADTAIFYSISSCHRGLTGVSLGDLLIKSVVERLHAELPNVSQFATLSPLPGFRRWLSSAIERRALDLSDDETDLLTDSRSNGPGAGRWRGGGQTDVDGDDREAALAVLADVVNGPMPARDDEILARARPALLRLAGNYLLHERRGARALDPVAHFHLSNGASLDQITWAANLTPAGWERGLGIMVTYRYRLRHIERNHDRYTATGGIAAADPVRKLVGSSPER